MTNILKSNLTIALARCLMVCLLVGCAHLCAFSQSSSCTPSYVTQWGSFGAGAGQFGDPSGVAVDSIGNVYVTDFQMRHVQKFDPQGNYLMEWGSFGTGDGQFGFLEGIAIDSFDHVYVVDGGNSRIQKFDDNGNFLGKWGTQGSGNGQFYGLHGIAIDAANNVYVTETHNYRVQKFTRDGVFLLKWGSQGTGNGQFQNPYAIATDSGGNVYVTDTARRIQKFNANGAYVMQWATNAVHGIAIDNAGTVYASDLSQIIKYNSNGAVLTQWGSNGSGAGQFNLALDIATDTMGNIYVVDNENCRIQKFACHPASAYKHMFSFDNSSETWASGYISPNDLHLLRYFDESLRFGSGYAETPTKVVQLEGADPLQPQELLICRGTNCETGAIIKLEPGGNVVELAQWSPDNPHPVGTVLSGNWSHIVSLGKNKLLLYENTWFQGKIVYLKGRFDTTYNNPQQVTTLSVPNPIWPNKYTEVVNTPRGVLFYNSTVQFQGTRPASKLVTLTESYGLCNGQPCNFPTITTTSTFITQPTGSPKLVRVRNNNLLAAINPSLDLMLAYYPASGSATLYRITGTTPAFQTVSGSQKQIGVGWNNAWAINDEIFFYNQGNYDYALGTVTTTAVPGSGSATRLNLTREVAGSAGILGGWSHLVPVLPTP
mgnify:CR=1 FL=1